MASGGKFAKKVINPTTLRVNTAVEKGSKPELLPGRRALNSLTKGDPWQRSAGNYSRLTPSGRNAPSSYRDLMDMAQTGGINLRRR